MLEEYDVLNRLENLATNCEIKGKLNVEFIKEFIQLERNRLDQELPCPEDFAMLKGGGYENSGDK